MTLVWKNLSLMFALSSLLAIPSLSGCALQAETAESETGQVSQPLTASVSLASKLVQVPARTMLTDSVSCPTGSLLVGGGYNGGTKAHVFRNYRTNNTWQVRIDNESDNTQLVNIIAQCLSGTNAVATDIRDDEGVLPGEQKCAFVECSSGIPASGGFYSTTDVDVYESRPVLNGWSVCAKNKGVAPISLRVTATCLTNFDATHAGYYADGIAAPNQDIVAEAECPEGRLRTGGGFEYDAVDSIDTGWNHASFQTELGWRVRVRNNTSTILPFKAHVNCLRPR